MARALVSALWLLAGCNEVLGIEEAVLDESIGRADAGPADECVLTSDCAADEVCIFRRCSPPCRAQRDCDVGERCLLTDEGNACVDADDNVCDADDDCPAPTVCAGGACQAECDTSDADACVEGQRCAEGLCVLAERDAGADAGAVAATAGDDCTPDATRCDATQGSVLTCGPDGSWGEPVPCAFVCADGACAGECAPDATRCADGVRQRCSAAGDWEDVEDCGSALCTPAACVDSCEEGEAFCSGNTLSTCNDMDTFVDQSCPYVCSDASGTAQCSGSCIPDARNCVGQTLQACNSEGEWISETSCQYVCNANACVGECRPMERECVDDATYHVCGDDGFWQSDVACTDQACASDSGTCIGACSPGDTRCGTGQVVQTCSTTGNWVTTESCIDQACAAAACVGVCSPGTSRCVAGPGTQQCQPNGTWGSTESCGAAACVSGQCTGSCVPNTTRCRPGSSVVVQRCSSQGVWQDDTTCVDQACVGGACSGSCTPDDTRCGSSNDVQTCSSSGSWGSGVTCSNQACVGGACQGVCAPQQTQCGSNNDVQRCSSSGSWGTGAPCTGQACVGGACQGSCEPSDVECVDADSYHVCQSNGAYGGTTDCVNQACVGSACTGVCGPGQRQCANANQYQVCSNTGQWGGATACTDQACSGGSCVGECAPGDTQCSGTNAQSCQSNGSWLTVDACNYPAEICRSGACESNDPYSLGNDASLASGYNVFADFIYMYKLPVLSNAASLETFGVWGNSSTLGAAKLVIYGGSASAPSGAPLAETQFPLTLGNGRVEQAATTFTFQSGAQYWLGMKVNLDTQIRGASNASATGTRLPNSYSDPFPSGMNGIATNGWQWAFFVTVRDQQ